MLSQEILNRLDDAWLGIDIDDKDIVNPLKSIMHDFEDQAHLALTYLLMQPHYCGIFCKEILNVEPTPLQMLMISESWNRKFPMWIATRGGSKTFTEALYCFLRAILIPGRQIIVAGSVFRQSKLVFEYMERIYKNSPRLQELLDRGSEKVIAKDTDLWRFRIGQSTVMCIPVGCLSGDTLITTKNGIYQLDMCRNQNLIWSNGKFRNIDHWYDNGIKDVVKITTKRGYTYTGTVDHRMKVVADNKITWQQSGDMSVGDYILLDKSIRWFTPSFNCTTDQAYVLGAMIGDGSYVRDSRLQFTNIDLDIIKYVDAEIGPIKSYDNLHYYTIGKDRLNRSASYRTKLWKSFWGLNDDYCENKILPESILKSDKDCVAACLQGLFDTDGTIQVEETKGGIQCKVNFCNTSYRLIKQVQYLLLHFGIMSTIISRGIRKTPLGNNSLPIYELYIFGEDLQLFKKYIGFRLNRKQDLLNYYFNKKKRIVSINAHIIPVSKEILLNITSKYPMKHPFLYSDIIRRKKFTRNYLIQFVQYLDSKGIVDTDIQTIRELLDTNIYYDQIVNIEYIGKEHVYDFHISDNNEYSANGFYSHNCGDTVRGLRANDLIIEEFAAHNRDVFETVLSGFTAVSASPVEKFKQKAKEELANKLGIEIEESKNPFIPDNQMLLCGTAYYQFNHFYDYWRKWKTIIETKGDRKAVAEIFGGDDNEHLNPDDYLVFRIPVELIPAGFMDESQIARSKASMHSGNYACEFGAVFSADSAGFYKRSLIESCVASDKNHILYNNAPIIFHPALSSRHECVMAIDPASEIDNFAVTILELHPTHRRIVYCWTITRKEQKERLKHGLIEENDFYKYCCLKIRELLKSFNIKRIALDSQGGGYAILEGLTSPPEGELPIYEIIDPENYKDTDSLHGLHIIEKISFADSKWVSDSNHGMRKDFEDKTLLFPYHDPLSYGFASFADEQSGKQFDSLEDCVTEIEELKDELSTIVITATASGREKWDTPEVKTAGKKGKLRKDRYTALLMANACAKKMLATPINLFKGTVGGFAVNEKNEEVRGPAYIGPQDLVQKLANLYDGV